jgi:hypothetical protein
MSRAADDWAPAVIAGDPVARRMLALLRALSVQEAEAWLQCGRRIVARTPPLEAGAMMLAELRAGAPDNLA